MIEAGPVPGEFQVVLLPVTRQALSDWMVSYVSALLAIDPAALDTSARFDAFGMDSIEAVVMAGVMEEEFGVPVEPGLLLEYPSIDAFSSACGSPA